MQLSPKPSFSQMTEYPRPTSSLLSTASIVQQFATRTGIYSILKTKTKNVGKTHVKLNFIVK